MGDPIIVLTKGDIEDLIAKTAAVAVESLKDDLERSRVREIMTKAELADYLRCDVSKINRLMGSMPHLSFGSTPRFRKSAIDEWLTNGGIQKIQGQTA